MIIGNLPNSALHALLGLILCTCSIFFTEFCMQGLCWMLLSSSVVLLTEWTPYFSSIQHNRQDDSVKDFSPDSNGDVYFMECSFDRIEGPVGLFF